MKKLNPKSRPNHHPFMEVANDEEQINLNDPDGFNPVHNKADHNRMKILGIIGIATLLIFALFYQLGSLTQGSNNQLQQASINHDNQQNRDISEDSESSQSELTLPFQREEQQNNKFSKYHFDFPSSLNDLQVFHQIIKKGQGSKAQWLSMQKPSNYHLYKNQTKLATSVDQLPMCIYTHKVGDKTSLYQIQQSLDKQFSDHHNFVHVYSAGPSFDQSDLKDQKFVVKYVPQSEEKFENVNQELRKNILQNCPDKSFIVIANNPIKSGILKILNILYQLGNIWLTYYSQRSNIPNYDQFVLNSVSSFHIQVLKRVPITKQQIKNNVKNMLLAMLQLTKYHALSIPHYYLYQNASICQYIDCIRGALHNKILVAPMMYLQPNRDPQQSVKTYLSKILSKKDPQAKYNERNEIKLEQMLRALQYLSLKKLPQNHFLQIRQINQYEKKYAISKYNKEQLPLCVIIPSRNNMNDDRYRKVLDTIKMQNYSNYHIIFIDDASTDATFQRSEKYLQKIGLFDRTAMIKNKQQKFATYNIQNAIKNHCKPKEISVLVDGDDQLIGKQVFKLINAAYRKKNNWIVYFSLISNIYMYGVSKVLKQQMFNQDGHRQQIHVIGALRTFYTDLYLKIDSKDHRDKNGNYLDSLYDDAMQYPMMQMSGMQHMEYIPEVVYFYNQNYGNNDASTPQTLKIRQQHREDIISRPKYKKLDQLFAS